MILVLVVVEKNTKGVVEGSVNIPFSSLNGSALTSFRKGISP